MVKLLDDPAAYMHKKFKKGIRNVENWFYKSPAKTDKDRTNLPSTGT
jgi:hypothetical protein